MYENTDKYDLSYLLDIESILEEAKQQYDVATSRFDVFGHKPKVRRDYLAAEKVYQNAWNEAHRALMRHWRELEHLITKEDFPLLFKIYTVIATHMNIKGRE